MQVHLAVQVDRRFDGQQRVERNNRIVIGSQRFLSRCEIVLDFRLDWADVWRHQMETGDGSEGGKLSVKNRFDFLKAGPVKSRLGFDFAIASPATSQPDIFKAGLSDGSDSVALTETS